MMIGSSYREIVEIAERYARLAQQKSVKQVAQQTITVQNFELKQNFNSTNNLDNGYQMIK